MHIGVISSIDLGLTLASQHPIDTETIRPADYCESRGNAYCRGLQAINKIPLLKPGSKQVCSSEAEYQYTQSIGQQSFMLQCRAEQDLLFE